MRRWYLPLPLTLQRPWTTYPRSRESFARFEFIGLTTLLMILAGKRFTHSLYHFSRSRLKSIRRYSTGLPSVSWDAIALVWRIRSCSICAQITVTLPSSVNRVRGRMGGSMTDTKREGAYSDAETAARAEAALKRMLATPPRPHKDSKLGRKRESGAK